MEPFEAELRRILSGTAPLPPAEVAGLNRRIVQSFARKQRRIRNITWVYLGVDLVAILILFALFLDTHNPKWGLLYGIGLVICFESTVLMKLWYWIVHSKISTLREIKQLELQVAQLAPREAQPRTEPPNVPPAESAAEQEPTAPPRTSWRAIGLGWLALLLITVLFVFPYAATRETKAIVYFEQVIRPAMAQGPQGWERTFEVDQPRKQFNVKINTQDPGARVWIELTGEPTGLLFQGSIEGYSNFDCGSGIAPGRYTVRLEYKQGGGDCTLRISGVDMIQPGTSPVRLVLLMLCAAVLGAVPLIFLQRGLLRRIDPELAK